MFSAFFTGNFCLSCWFCSFYSKTNSTILLSTYVLWISSSSFLHCLCLNGQNFRARNFFRWVRFVVLPWFYNVFRAKKVLNFAKIAFFLRPKNFFVKKNSFFAPKIHKIKFFSTVFRRHNPYNFLLLRKTPLVFSGKYEYFYI